MNSGKIIDSEISSLSSSSSSKIPSKEKDKIEKVNKDFSEGIQIKVSRLESNEKIETKKKPNFEKQELVNDRVLKDENINLKVIEEIKQEDKNEKSSYNGYNFNFKEDEKQEKQ